MSVGRVIRVGWDYTLGRFLGKPSTARFWYLQAPAQVYDEASFADYLGSGEPYPKYLFDQTVKLAYPSVKEPGVPVLHYGAPTGDQENPEAAFQYALGLGESGRGGGEALERFLQVAGYWRERQSANGLFPYMFDWHESKAPWASALAQARGASVMLRAWMGSGDERFLDSARGSVEMFEVPLEEGGFGAVHPVTGTPYFEEYPKAPTAVMNGFLSTVFGLWELGHWADDARAKRLFATACDSLERVLPVYTTDWWTLYDLRESQGRRNVQSPFYHSMVTEYMKVLCQLDGREAFASVLGRWTAMDTFGARARAAWEKAVFKVVAR